jgi:hypothetical protein
MSIKKNVLMDCLKNFAAIKMYMEAIAEEKLQAHLSMVSAIVQRYNNPKFRTRML